MSDMEQSDVAPDAEAPENAVEAVADDASVAEPAAPGQPEVPVDPVAGFGEPTAKKLQAEIDELQEAIDAQKAAPNPQPDPWPVPVIARVPSGESATQQPEAAPEVDQTAAPLADAVRSLLILIKAHRTAGDSDLEAAVAAVESALAEQA